MKIITFFMKKPNEEGRISEDYSWINPEIQAAHDSNPVSYPRLIAVLSDGAGGVGLFAAEWAKQLTKWVVEFFSERPILSVLDFESVIVDNWEAFQTEQLRKVAAGGAQFDKFSTQGSLATILALWQVDAATFHVFAIGDTCVIKVSDDTIQVFPEAYANTELFANGPTLVSLFEPLALDSEVSQSFDLKPGEKIILATDAVAEHCINQLKGPAPLRKLSNWVASIGLKGDSVKKSYFEKRVKDQSLRPDDYSFILVSP